MSGDALAANSSRLWKMGVYCTRAAGWKVFKATDPGPSGAVIYVFIIDPAAKGQEYSVGNLLVEAFGAEGQTLYKTYSESYANPAIGALLHLTSFLDLK